ncbi:MAG: transglycosylase SLT domain-containing protein [Bacteroidota bacterium]
MNFRILLRCIGLSFLPLNGMTQTWINEQLEVKTKNHLTRVMHSDALFMERWVNLPQPQFWRRIMQLPPDSCLVNVARTRQVLATLSNAEWSRKTDTEKAAYKAELKRQFQVDSSEAIYVTTGKSDFYRFHEVFPSLGQGIKVFEDNQVDPWFAQAILLIESPAQLRKSISGAYGAFQLMPSVAKNYGLTVNASIDERANFSKSAYAASQLLKQSCIPSARKILNQTGISYNEQEMGFRLLVMHVYHAGSGNVAAVVKKINPTTTVMDLIQSMWVTSAASFGNNSQNYSQLALAAQWLLHDYIYSTCDEISPCSGK